MDESKIELIELKGFTINITGMGAPMTIRAEGNEVVILMRLALRPRDNMMDISIEVPTSGDRAPMPSLNEDSSSDFSRYWRATVHD